MASTESHIRITVDRAPRDIVSRPYVFQHRPPGEDAWRDVGVFSEAADALTTVAEAAAGKFDGYLPAGPHYRVVDQRTGQVVAAET
jgi:hypothetical protein